MIFDGVVRRVPVTVRCEQGPEEVGRPAGGGVEARAECGRNPQVTDVSRGARVLKSVAVGLIFIRKGR